jgi:hypothetical protein
MTIPKKAVENKNDNTKNIIDDIPKLYDKYIKVIDNIRSISRPSENETIINSNNTENKSNKTDFKNLNVDAVRPLESRCHAFYRMLGFPVVAGNDFYNPGFDPENSIKAETKVKISEKFYTEYKNLANLIRVRERKVSENKEIFKRRDNTSVVYAILMRYPADFNVLDDSKEPLVLDQQKSTVDARDLEIDNLITINSNQSELLLNVLSESSKYTTIQHILKPFIVDPRIENTVMPDVNKICVPFLKDKNSTKLTKDSYLFRPGIELIIRERLNQSQGNAEFLKQLENVIKNNNQTNINTNTLNTQDILQTLEALSDENNIVEDNIRDVFSGVTSVQFECIKELIKTIKAVVNKLFKATTQIDICKNNINWTPMPSIDGPENLNQAKLIRNGFIGSSNEINTIQDLDNRIVKLNVLKLNAEHQVTTGQDLGNFASPFTVTVSAENVDNLNDELQQAVKKRDEFAQKGFQALRDIEIITGEVSGLGLIDILAIYTALWSIDLKTLIHFLDEQSFLRMVTYNEQYKGISEVDERFSLGPQMSIEEVLKKFENKLANILNFADKLKDEMLNSPNENTSSAPE